jgi:hypothetical protein
MRGQAASRAPNTNSSRNSMARRVKANTSVI